MGLGLRVRAVGRAVGSRQREASGIFGLAFGGGLVVAFEDAAALRGEAPALLTACGLAMRGRP